MAGIPINTILGSIPEALKPKGLAKLPQLILDQGVKIDTLLQPSIDNITSQIPQDQSCLPEPELNIIIAKRDNIVNILNSIGNILDSLSSSLTSLANFLDLTITLLQVLKSSKFATSLASKFIPIVPGAVTSTLSDLGDAIRDITFDKEGNSKLKDSSNIINASALSVAVVNNYITILVTNIQLLDKYLQGCTNKNLTPISNTISEVTRITLEASQTSNQSTYKGFVIEIEEVPFNDKINRIRAIALNKYGIKMAESELSFSTNPQTLINELKFIIDRDNLKAD